LVCVYGPCSGPERDIFVQWLHDLDCLTTGFWWVISTS
jgi:hypothetical protein